MTQVEISTLQVGSHLRLGGFGVAGRFHKTGFVDMVKEQGNYVRIQWRDTKRPDILSRTSPLWLVMELLP